MTNTLSTTLLLLSLCAPLLLMAQLLPDDVTFEDMAEQAATSLSEDTDLSGLAEHLAGFATNPLDINAATYEELAALRLLNDYQAHSLLQHIARSGPILSFNELTFVYGFDEWVVNRLRPFTRLGPGMKDDKPSLRSALKQKGKHQLYMQGRYPMQLAEGYKPVADSTGNPVYGTARYTGSPLRMRTRYTFQTGGHIYAGLQGVKGAGEPLFRRSNPHGFDFYSGYLQVKGKKVLRNFLIGDYQLHFGQGLVLWGYLSFGKLSADGSQCRWAEGIRYYGSSDENRFFRGTASSFRLLNADITLFASFLPRDATISDTLPNGRMAFSSWQTSGYHRTAHEIANEKSINELALGANIRYGWQNLKIGFTSVQYNLSGLYVSSDKLYNLHTFRGSALNNSSLDYRWRLKHAMFFGELAAGNHSPAILTGIDLYPVSPVQLSVVYRNYARGFYTHRGNPFSEYSSGNNEEGLFVSAVFQVWQGIRCQLYADVFKSHWPRYNINAPSTGRELRWQFEYEARQGLHTILTLSSKNNERNISSSPVTHVGRYTLSRLRWQARWQVNNGVTLNSRLEGVHYGGGEIPRQQGWLASQDAIFTYGIMGHKTWVRVGRFDINGYDARIYTYEHSLPYTFSLPSFFNKGLRGYVMQRMPLGGYFTLWARYTCTHYYGLDKTGSGSDTVIGNLRSDIAMMLIWKPK